MRDKMITKGLKMGKSPFFTQDKIEIVGRRVIAAMAEMASLARQNRGCPGEHDRKRSVGSELVLGLATNTNLPVATA